MKDTTKKAYSILIFALSPLVMYLVFEWITGNLTEIRGIYLLLNLIFFYMVYLLVFALTNSMKIVFSVLNMIFTFWAMAEYFVVEFRQRPIMLWDILAVRTAAAVAANYSYDFTWRLAAGGLAVLSWTVLIWFFPVKMQTKKLRLSAIAGSFAAFCLFLAYFYGTAIQRWNIEINMWAPKDSYAEYGYMVSSLRVPAYIHEKPPEGYSLQAVNDIMEESKAAREEQDNSLPWKSSSDIVPTNIICIMNESYSDLRVIAPFSTDTPFMPCYEGLTDNCVKGNLYVPVFGSMTSNTEFEFLTANNIGFTPSGSVPYQFYMRNPTYSLAGILKDQGYQTIAMHPNDGANWNRNQAYAAMGFDEFYDISAFEDAPLVRNYVSDLGTYEKIIELTEEKEEGQPLFIFDVTMQNHGGYEEEGYETTVYLTDYDDFPMTEQYLSLIRTSDEALQYLLDYYGQVEEPTMIVMFGDHQPSVEEEFFETLYGQPLDELSSEDYSRMYITPFLIWTNYPTEPMEVEALSAQYLSGAILQRANLRMSDFLYFVDAMSRQAPVVHPIGYYNADMTWEDWSGWGDWEAKKEYPLFHQFDMLQYHNMFEKRRIDDFF